MVAGDVWEGDSRRALETVANLADGKPAITSVNVVEFPF